MVTEKQQVQQEQGFLSYCLRQVAEGRRHRYLGTAVEE